MSGIKIKVTLAKEFCFCCPWELQDGDDLTIVAQSLEELLVKTKTPSLEVKKLEYSLRLKIKCNDWLLADTCPQAANHRALF